MDGAPPGLQGPQIPDNGVPGPAGTRGPTDPADIRSMQAFLRSQGYNITVDGIYGPQTDSAKADWQSGVGRRNPSRWNQQQRSGGRAAAPASRSPVKPPVYGPPAPSVPQMGNGGGTTYAELLKLLGPDTFNPKAYAQSEVNAAYDPQIAQMKRDIGLTSKQDAVKQQHIMDWFSQLAQYAQKASQGASADISSAMQNATPQGISNPAAAASAAKVAGIYDTSGTNIKSNLLAQLANSVGLDALKGGEFFNQQKAGMDQNEADLRSQLLSAIQSKGKAYTSALDNAINMGTQQRGARINQLLTLLMAPGQLQTQALGNFFQKAQGNLGLQQGALNLQGTAIDNLMRQHNLTAAQKGVNNSSQWADPSFQASFSRGVRGTIMGPKGNFVGDPRLYWNQIASEYNLKNNPAALRIMSAVFAEVLNHSHIAGEYRHVSMGPNGPTG